MAAIIEIKEVTRRYGDRTAVDSLDLEVQECEIFGFVGPNGAGKTTTLRMMATLLQPSAGEIHIAGSSVKDSPREVRRVLGYMPDFFGVYTDMKVWEYLDFFAACYGIPEVNRTGIITDLLELVDLGHRREDMVDKLSRGMKQRLSLARTLVNDPQVLVLDEPASGLDPRARVEIRQLILELARMGKTIFFSTHILADVAEICTRVGIIEAGVLVAAGSLDALHLQWTPARRVEVIMLGGAQEAQRLLTALPGVSSLHVIESQNHSDEGTGVHERGVHERLEFQFSGNDAALSALLSKLVSGGIRVVHFSEDRRDLEEVFMQATKGLVT
jgi:ABC-2 type transport system ATP-binding protein